MLDTFIYSAKQLEDKHLGNDVAAQVTESKVSDNPSARLDIDTPKSVARITCWESGDYNAEIMDVETERTLYSINGRLREEKSLSMQFANFFESLGLEVE